jgi:pimeloyl-ACP methyl ester carboxylesterase
LDLEDVVLVGNDTGGVVTQLVAVHHPERLGALVLTSCDAFEHFPPPILKPVILAAKSKALFRTAIQTMRAPAARKRAFDGLAYHNIDDLTEIWVRPALSDRAIAEDLRQFTLWSADDTFFEVADGERLAATIPNAHLEVIDGARTFSMVDRPDRLADLLSGIAVRA